MSQETFVSRIGIMRLALLITTVICFPMALFANMEPNGIGILTAYVIPSIVVILIFVLLLDALMSRVFMVELAGEERSIKRLRVKLNLFAVVGIFIFWGPYFQQIGAL